MLKVAQVVVAILSLALSALLVVAHDFPMLDEWILVNIIPNVRPAVRVPFPAIRDWYSLRITLRRKLCFEGTCPDYEVELSGDGAVRYQGNAFVALQGPHRAQVSITEVKALFEQFREADFFWLNDAYAANITDNPTQVATISFDGRTKTVIDYIGELARMPAAVRELEEAIDRAAGVERWTKGNDETLDALVAEHWDFKSQRNENLSVVPGVARHGSASALRKLIAASAPVPETYLADQYFFDKDAVTKRTIDVARARGDKEILQLIEEALASRKS